MKIWQKYLLKRLISIFCFLLLSIFTIYVLVDLSINGIRFFHKGMQTLNLMLYYMQQFAMHLDLFLPLTFLLAILKLLFDLNHNLELVALQMAGLSKRKILLPFLAFALTLSALCYANSQWFSPDATLAAQTFKSAHSKHKKKVRRNKCQALALEDGSELIYQKYESTTHELFDVFWIRSPKDIWHMKTLNIGQSVPHASFADHLERKPHFTKTQSFDSRPFPEIPLSEETAPKTFVPFESRPLSTLFREALYASSDIASVRTHLHYKLAIPWLAPLLLLLIAPIATRFSRKQPVFLISALSLFSFLSLKILFDSLLILGENQVIAPWAAMWTPLILLSFYAIQKFRRAENRLF